jgi:uncharacterized protein (DUF1697 family)
MHRYVAFLKGINVGGRIVVKETLQEAFKSLGFQNVSTYKQSGNVIFESESDDQTELKLKIENKLQGTLGFEVPVFLRTIQQLKTIITLDPFKGQNRDEASFLVTFLTSEPSNFPLQLPVTIPKSTAQVISFRGIEVFSVTHGGGEGALPNPYLESKLKVKATTRNMNIIRELVEKY